MEIQFVPARPGGTGNLSRNFYVLLTLISILACQLVLLKHPFFSSLIWFTSVTLHISLFVDKLITFTLYKKNLGLITCI